MSRALPEPESGRFATSRYFGNRVAEVKHDLRFSRPHSRLVLLIHGYNVGIASAHKTLKAFESNIKGLMRHSSVSEQQSIMRDLAWFIWPGDMVGLGYEGSAIFYSKVLKRAPMVGKSLGEWVWELRDLYRRQGQAELKVIFVAHSLGCRVTLEAISIIRGMEKQDESRMQINVFLMAPAVPVEFLASGRRLRTASEQTTHRGLMYSTEDSVLGIPFRLGQALGRERGGPAVGRTGRPTDLWGRWAYSTNWGHGDYWKKGARTLLNWMGYAVPKESPTLEPPVHQQPLHHLPLLKEPSSWM